MKWWRYIVASPQAVFSNTWVSIETGNYRQDPSGTVLSAAWWGRPERQGGEHAAEMKERLSDGGHGALARLWVGSLHVKGSCLINFQHSIMGRQLHKYPCVLPFVWAVALCVFLQILFFKLSFYHCDCLLHPLSHVFCLLVCCRFSQSVYFSLHLFLLHLSCFSFHCFAGLSRCTTAVVCLGALHVWTAAASWLRTVPAASVNAAVFNNSCINSLILSLQRLHAFVSTLRLCFVSLLQAERYTYQIVENRPGTSDFGGPLSCRV